MLGTCPWPASRVWAQRFPRGAGGEFPRCLSASAPRVASVEVVLREASDRWAGTVRAGTWGAGKKAWDKGFAEAERRGSREEGTVPLCPQGLTNPSSPRAPLLGPSEAPGSFAGEEGVEISNPDG